jgi:hypothetical protein
MTPQPPETIWPHVGLVVLMFIIGAAFAWAL